MGGVSLLGHGRLKREAFDRYISIACKKGGHQRDGSVVRLQWDPGNATHIARTHARTHARAHTHTHTFSQGS
jgi:hypothetical protein